jgi:hypothetical protein
MERKIGAEEKIEQVQMWQEPAEYQSDPRVREQILRSLLGQIYKWIFLKGHFSVQAKEPLQKLICKFWTYIYFTSASLQCPVIGNVAQAPNLTP